MIYVNGRKENRFRFKDQEALVARPIKYVTKSGMHLSITYNLLAGHLSMRHQGIDAEKLPLVKQSLLIY